MMSLMNGTFYGLMDLIAVLWIAHRNHKAGLLGYNTKFQIYTEHPGNMMLQGGKLHLRIICDLNAEVGYTSRRINSINKVQIKFEMVDDSIKTLDIRLGLWPAFWALGHDFEQAGWPAAGEIHIMEMGQK